jgi:thioredoxin 1
MKSFTGWIITTAVLGCVLVAAVVLGNRSAGFQGGQAAGNNPGFVSTPSVSTPSSTPAPATNNTGSMPAPAASNTSSASAPAASSESNTPTLVELGAAWCHFCEMEKPVIDALKVEAKGKLNFRYIDTDNERTAAASYQVEGIPLLVLESAEGKVLWRHAGYLDKEQLKAELKANGVAL